MDISITKYKRCTAMTVSGRVDSNTAPEFEEKLKEIIDGGQHNIVLEMSGVNFLSSAGLRGMVSALKACKNGGGTLVLASPSKRVSEVMQLAGLVPLFASYDDITSAVGSF
jgi:anti-sigma B factor antagonist